MANAYFNMEGTRSLAGMSGIALPTDRTHTFNAIVQLNVKHDEGPTIGGYAILADTRLWLALGFRSGLARSFVVSSTQGSGIDPFTGYSVDGGTVYDWYRLPDTWISRAHLSRDIPLADFF